ncbi:MauE/DoxX family redox-associated membrane protein [Sinomicrobium sp. M5D2P9]
MKNVTLIIPRFVLRHRNVFIEIICFLFIILFLYAATTKLMDYEKFRVQIGQSPILISIGAWIAWFIPVTELIIAGMLVVSRFREIALYASFSLMTMFTAYIYIILHYSPFVPCSCGGILEKMGWEEHLVFNIIFVLLALIGILILSQKSVVSLKPTSK